LAKLDDRPGLIWYAQDNVQKHDVSCPTCCRRSTLTVRNLRHPMRPGVVSILVVVGVLAITAAIAVMLAGNHRRNDLPSVFDINRAVGDLSDRSEIQQSADLMTLFYRGTRLSATDIKCIVDALCNNALIGDDNQQTMLRICREGGKQLENALLERLLRSLEKGESCKVGGNSDLLHALESIDSRYRDARSGESGSMVYPEKLREIGEARGTFAKR
jgi:hypothetical protein